MSVKFRIFAGVSPNSFPEDWDADKVIRCRRLVSGTVAYGTLIEEGR